MGKQGTPAENIARNFASFVSAHITDFEPPIDSVQSFYAGAEYGVNDSNALLPINTVRFEMRRSSSLDFASGQKAPTIYGVTFIPEINNTNTLLGQLSSSWEVGILGRAVRFKYFPDGENDVRSSCEPFARLIGRLALFEEAGQLTLRGQEQRIGQEKPIDDAATVDTTFQELLKRNNLI